jgi:hypothetical protein
MNGRGVTATEQHAYHATSAWKPSERERHSIAFKKRLKRIVDLNLNTIGHETTQQPSGADGK